MEEALEFMVAKKNSSRKISKTVENLLEEELQFGLEKI